MGRRVLGGSVRHRVRGGGSVCLRWKGEEGGRLLRRDRKDGESGGETGLGKSEKDGGERGKNLLTFKTPRKRELR